MKRIWGKHIYFKNTFECLPNLIQNETSGIERDVFKNSLVLVSHEMHAWKLIQGMISITPTK